MDENIPNEVTMDEEFIDPAFLEPEFLDPALLDENFDPEQIPDASSQIFYLPSIERLRIILMFFMCINLFGFPTAFGDVVRTVCGFVPLAFFILSGFLVLRDTPDRSERIVRAIKRTAVAFAVFAAVLLVLNFFYYRLQGINILPIFGMGGFWLDFLVMNTWPFSIGNAIWYLQALLYTYIIAYFLDKWKLLRFDWLFSALLIVLAVISGELAGVFNWNVAGLTYLPGNFLTRALPYVLLGAFISRKILSLVEIKRPLFWVGIVLGAALIIAEVVFLDHFDMPGYYGHLIGMGVIAFSVCMLAFQDSFPEPGFEAALKMSRKHVNLIYYLCQPACAGFAFLLTVMGEDIAVRFVGFTGIVVFVVCFCIARFVALIERSRV